MKVLLVGPLLFPIHGQSLAFTRFVDSFDTNNKTVINTNAEGLPLFLKVLTNFKNLAQILWFISFYRFDVVYFTCSRSILGSFKDVFLIYLASKKNIRIINHLHGSDFYEFLHDVPKWYRKILFSAYSKVGVSIVLLERMKEQFKDFDNMKIEVIPNFYDKEMDADFIEMKSDVKKIVYLSNVMASKGIFELISAFKDLSESYNSIKLTIAGDFISDQNMNYEEVKSKFFSEVHSSENINYVGKVYGEEKVKLLQTSDIFILPSYYVSEAFPISILEAMACKNAIITTNHKYLPDVVTEENGLLAEPKSAASLSKCIQDLLDNVELLETMKKNNRLHAREKYSLEKYLFRLKALIKIK